ncbi:hypothetical protein B0H19DRAFT_1082712 [Mycena capillaripes]|nr:hypothetical protein B0H19DRAFT_1082712 [Mycena capillaripes]
MPLVMRNRARMTCSHRPIYTPDSSSSSDSDSVSNSDIKIVKKLAAEALDSDVLEVASSVAGPSEATKCRLKFRYALLTAPWTEMGHDDRAGTSPRLEQPVTQQVALFKRVFKDTKLNPQWAEEEECCVCLNGRPKIVLSCACRHKLFHAKCAQDWHEKQDPLVQSLLRCPICKREAKPLHLAWVTPSVGEIEAQKMMKSKRKHEKERKDVGRRQAKAANKVRKRAAKEAEAKEAAATEARMREAAVKAAQEKVLAAARKAAMEAEVTAMQAASTQAASMQAASTQAASSLMQAAAPTGTVEDHYVAPGLFLQGAQICRIIVHNFLLY